MRKLKVFIEINGEFRFAGAISGNDHSDAVFEYDRDYMDSDLGRPVSVSLPFRE